MTPQQALAILVQVAEQAPLPKAGHVQVEQAATTLHDYLNGNGTEPTGTETT